MCKSTGFLKSEFILTFSLFDYYNLITDTASQKEGARYKPELDLWQFNLVVEEIGFSPSS